MTRLVALLRGINVGRAKRIAMADWRALLEAMGYRNVRTLLNSGNAVFDGSAKDSAWHARRIRAAVAKELGVDAATIVKSADEIASIMIDNAVIRMATDPSRLLVAVTQDAAALAAVAALGDSRLGEDKLHVCRHAAYLWCASGILNSAVAVALLKQLHETGTTRNWATMQKINALMQNPTSGHRDGVQP